MGENKLIKARTCKKCKAKIESDAKEIKDHAKICRG